MRAAIVIGGIVVVALIYFFVSPLFIDEEVAESLPFEQADGTVDVDMVMSMPEAERMKMKDDIMRVAAAAPDRAMADQMDGEAALLAQGTFVDADAVHKGEGDALLYRAPDGRHLVRFENFKTTNGPALVVYLARHENPTTADDVTSGGFVRLGDLKGNVGDQNYWLPEGTDINQFGSVVIWCELFGVLFSPAALAEVAG